MVTHLVSGAGQPCLVIVASRKDAKDLAELVAVDLEVEPANAGLVDLLRAHLPASHRLPDLVAKGVAYHHGVLPQEVQAELEEATRRRQLRCVVATTTLTEGVNLPFKSVVIGKTGWGSGENRQEIIDPARLLNAFGRAGRACRETEGWIFYALFETFNQAQLQRFDRTSADLELFSTLASEEALASLEAFEALVAEGADAVLADTGAPANGFVAYVWFLAEVLQQLRPATPVNDAVKEALTRTLAWQQFDEARRGRWAAVVEAGLERYESTPAEQRRRWSRSGTSLSSAVRLEAIARNVRNRVIAEGRARDPTTWLRLVLADDVLPSLLSLPENERFRGIRPRANVSLNQAVYVDFLELLLRWVSGDELDAIGNDLLGEISDQDYRADALAEFVAAVFEHHLPWVLRALIEWVNVELPDVSKVPLDLPGHIQHGVATPAALELMLNGVRSRRLATVVAETLGSQEPERIRQRVAQLTIDQWRDYFQATPTELQDLLGYVHDPSIQAVSTLLRGLPVNFAFDPISGVVLRPADEVSIVLEATGPNPRPYLAVRDGEVIGTVESVAHKHVEALLGLGQPLSVTIPDPDTPSLEIRSST